MIDLSEKFKEIEAHCHEIELQLANPDTVKDLELYKKLTRSHSELNEVVQLFRKREKLLHRIGEAEEMLGEDDPEMVEMAEAELAETRAEFDETEERIQVLLLPGDPRDARNTIIEIRAGTGGEEAALFARDLFEMYSRYAELKKWKIEVLEANGTDYGGYKEVTFLMLGDRVYSRLKYEAGTHRVQRVPSTESQGRIHTSAVTVAVMPEAEDFDIEIRNEDLRIDTFRASGAGGQHVNKTDSAVRITHMPTNVVVSCQNERSQHQNRHVAMKMLRSKLFEAEERKRQDEMAASRKAMVGTGDRSGRIRTYNFPQNRMSDHRINLTLYSLEEIMQGDLDPTIDALASHAQAEALKNV